MRVVTSFTFILHVRRRYRNAPRFLLRRIVDLVIALDVSTELRRRHHRQRRRQRRLTVIHMTNRPHVDVRLRSFKFLLGHWRYPYTIFVLGQLAFLMIVSATLAGASE